MRGLETRHHFVQKKLPKKCTIDTFFCVQYFKASSDKLRQVAICWNFLKSGTSYLYIFSCLTEHRLSILRVNFTQTFVQLLVVIFDFKAYHFYILIISSESCYIMFERPFPGNTWLYKYSCVVNSGVR